MFNECPPLWVLGIFSVVKIFVHIYLVLVLFCTYIQFVWIVWITEK